MVGAIVLMPDILDGGRDMSKMPTDPEEKKKAMDAWWAGPGHLPTVSKFVRDCAEAIKPNYPSVEKIGAIGLCYGGKVTILAENMGPGVFDATAQAHPGRLSAEDAKKLTSPHLCMASKDEDAAEVKAFDAIEKPKGSVTCTYEDMFHGWMGARARVAEEHYANEYKRGYEQFSKWFLNIVA
jgi:dienelactone hydrolase